MLFVWKLEMIIEPKSIMKMLPTTVGMGVVRRDPSDVGDVSITPQADVKTRPKTKNARANRMFLKQSNSDQSTVTIVNQSSINHSSPIISFSSTYEDRQRAECRCMQSRCSARCGRARTVLAAQYRPRRYDRSASRKGL